MHFQRSHRWPERHSNPPESYFALNGSEGSWGRCMNIMEVRGIEIWTYLQQPISGLCTYHAPTAATGYCPPGSLRRLQQPGITSEPRGTHTTLNAKSREDAGAPIGGDHFCTLQRVIRFAGLSPLVSGKITEIYGVGPMGDINPTFGYAGVSSVIWIRRRIFGTT